MPDKKISELNSAATLGGSELIPMVQSGGNVIITAANLASYIQAGFSVTGLVPRGPYDPDAVYVANDLLTYNGSMFICKVSPEEAGVLPTNTTYFMGIPIGTTTTTTTYAELCYLMDNAGLTIGNLYMFTYTAVLPIEVNNELFIGDTPETIIVRANSDSTISPEAFSVTYPHDVIRYSVDRDRECLRSTESTTEQAAAFSGYIAYREDTIRQISAWRDWRNMKTRLYEMADDEESENYCVPQDKPHSPNYADFPMLDPENSYEKITIGYTLIGEPCPAVFKGNGTKKINIGQAPNPIILNSFSSDVEVATCGELIALGEVRRSWVGPQCCMMVTGDMSGTTVLPWNNFITITGNIDGCIVLPGVNGESDFGYEGNFENSFLSPQGVTTFDQLAGNMSEVPDTLTVITSPCAGITASRLSELQVVGGTSVGVEFSRNGSTWYTVNAPVLLNRGDHYRVTFDDAETPPTILVIPR